jgi:hypothetical protein
VQRAFLVVHAAAFAALIITERPMAQLTQSSGLSIIVLIPFDQDHNRDERDDTQQHP